MVEQSNKFERSNQRNKTTNAELRKELTQLKKEVAQGLGIKTARRRRKALKNAKSELESMKTQRDILQLRPASSYGQVCMCIVHRRLRQNRLPPTRAIRSARDISIRNHTHTAARKKEKSIAALARIVIAERLIVLAASTAVNDYDDMIL
eukprot:g47201.t1